MFVFGISSILGMLIFNESVSVFNEAGFIGENYDTAIDGFRTSLLVFDYIAIIVLVVLLIGIALTSYKLNTAPVFFIVTLLISPFYAAFAYFMTYNFSQIVSDSTFSTVLIYFPKTLMICTNLHWIALSQIIIGSLALYAKKENTSM